MKNLKQLLVSGLIGVGIGMSWLAVETSGMYYSENLTKSTINVSTFLFWVLASFGNWSLLRLFSRVGFQQ